MDPVAAPLASGLLLAISAIASTGGAPGEAADVIRGILGNWAANGLEAGSIRLLERISDDSIDPATNLPRNHDIQRASADALRGAATA
jgi:hypothetical protein